MTASRESTAVGRSLDAGRAARGDGAPNEPRIWVPISRYTNGVRQSSLSCEVDSLLNRGGRHFRLQLRISRFPANILGDTGVLYSPGYRSTHLLGYVLLSVLRLPIF